jgi:hypothetical protein
MTNRTWSRWLCALSVAIVAGWIAGSAAAQGGQAYKYKDERGRIHFTDNIYDIPAKFRSQVETRDMPAHIPQPGSAEEKQAPPPEGSIEASFQDGLQQGMGTSSLDPKQQQAFNEWIARWKWPFIGTSALNVLIALALIVHAFTQGHVGWGLLNFVVGVTTPVYLLIHVEQPIAARLGLLALYLSPFVVIATAGVQLAGALGQA